MEGRKKRRALELIAAGDFGLSIQVLQEFYVTFKRLSGPGYRREIALRWLEQLARFPVAELDLQLLRSAVAISERFEISYWDAAIVAAAEVLGAGVLYSEDLNHGQTYGGVRVVNPFESA